MLSYTPPSTPHPCCACKWTKQGMKYTAAYAQGSAKAVRKRRQDHPLHREALGSRLLGKTSRAESHVSGARVSGARTGTQTCPLRGPPGRGCSTLYSYHKSLFFPKPSPSFYPASVPCLRPTCWGETAFMDSQMEPTFLAEVNWNFRLERRIEKSS